MNEDDQEQFRELIRQGEIESARQEAQLAIDKAKKPKTPTRWLTPDELRRAAEEWVDGRNRVIAAREAYREAGIIASMKSEYLVPESLKEPLYSAVLALMVEREEWPTEPGTNVPKWKRTPTINYWFKVEGNQCKPIPACMPKRDIDLFEQTTLRRKE
jgi:hypothetical protein